MNIPKITYHVFVCDSENYMDKPFWNYFLGKSDFSYMKYAFGINFAIISGWSVYSLGPEGPKTEKPNRGHKDWLPEGPGIEKIRSRPSGLKFSIEIEIFKRATRQTPIFCGEF